MNVRLNKDQKIKLSKSNDVYNIMQQVLLRENKIGRNKEHFWIICLASNNQILMIELISLGTVSSTLVDPTEVFSFALQKRAVKIMLIHNHPSGDLEPSAADKEITERMMAVGKFIQVPIIDHLIISETEYYSFADEGVLDQIENHTPFDLTFSNVIQLREDIKRTKLESDNAMLKMKEEMAVKSLAKGLSIDDIVDLTGLTKKQVEKLVK